MTDKHFEQKTLPKSINNNLFKTNNKGNIISYYNIYMIEVPTIKSIRLLFFEIHRPKQY